MENTTELSNNLIFPEFTRKLGYNSIRYFVRPTIDTTLILDRFKKWGPLTSLSIKNLTDKLCQILLVTEFLRASDIQGIDEGQSNIVAGILHLVMVAPREKAGGRSIKYCFQISPQNTLFCALY
ncbi:hypothetical protein AYI68_g4038 [Smittium mucronatum]|uniref:Uncharacterized protein n=1 Tax=Smittium mucronatum TaxID=133383 RepID=A0A1R0GY79_9FUNG|nr:hypothetical protein AYI68_g4038 [Smittium mucronatum]